jgi:AraC-like DNA-binding protein
VPVEEHLMQVLQNLSPDEIMNLSIEELAAKFSCSRRHLSRLFHQHFGLSVASLKMEIRLLNAVSLLRNLDTKVINVAEECGFNHTGLFNTCFKRRFGVSPGQWRKSIGQTATKSVGSNGASSNCSLRSSGLCPWMSDSDADTSPEISPMKKKGARKVPARQRLAAATEILSVPNAQAIRPRGRNSHRVSI